MTSSLHDFLGPAQFLPLTATQANTYSPVHCVYHFSSAHAPSSLCRSRCISKAQLTSGTSTPTTVSCSHNLTSVFSCSWIVRIHTFLFNKHWMCPEGEKRGAYNQPGMKRCMGMVHRCTACSTDPRTMKYWSKSSTLPVVIPGTML